MRAAALALALGVSFNLAIANVICNTEAIHSKPRIITGAEKDGFASSIKEVCNASSAKKLSTPESQSGFTVFSITRNLGSVNDSDCEHKFNSIIEECVAGHNFGGGSFMTDSLILKISIDTAADQAPGARSLDARARTRSRKKTKSKSKTKSKTKSKKKPAKDTTACPIKGNHGKKPKKGIRSLISKLFARSPTPSRCESPLKSGMEKHTGWGNTWFGFVWNGNPVTSKQLQDYAEEAYKEVRAQNAHVRILVSAIHVPGEGVFLGTLPDATGQAKFLKGIDGYPKLKELFAERKLLKPSASLVHAEDAAMYWAYSEKASKSTDRFPDGSTIVTYGQYYSNGDAAKRSPCSAGSIDPSCRKNLVTMNIKEG